MKVISVRDIMLAEELSHIKNEVSLIHPENDDVVEDVLAEIGFDTNQPWEYVAGYHRDLQNKVALGFRIVGEYNPHPKFNKFLDTTDRVILAGQQDISLGKELANLMGRRFNYKNEDEYDIGKKKSQKDRYFSDDELLAMGYTDADEEDYDEVDFEDELTQQIDALEDIKKTIRGG